MAKTPTKHKSFCKNAFILECRYAPADLLSTDHWEEFSHAQASAQESPRERAPDIRAGAFCERLLEFITAGQEGRLQMSNACNAGRRCTAGHDCVTPVTVTPVTFQGPI